MQHSNLTLDTTMSDDRVQHLLAKQAELDQLQAQVKAELSSLRSIPLSTSPSSSSQLGRVHKHQQHRRGNMSRSSSTNGPIPMGRHISSVGQTIWPLS